MRLRERFQRMMYGRYGSDQLSKFCFVLYLVIWVVGLFIRVPEVRIGLNLFSYVIIFVYFFRFQHRSICLRGLRARRPHPLLFFQADVYVRTLLLLPEQI